MKGHYIYAHVSKDGPTYSQVWGDAKAQFYKNSLVFLNVIMLLLLFFLALVRIYYPIFPSDNICSVALRFEL